MVTKVIIKDNTNAPIRYLSTLKNFSNGTEYNFNDGVNIIVGENGSGKTTLLNLIKAYLLVDNEQCGKGVYNANLNYLYRGAGKDFHGGVDVYADYTKNTFRLCHLNEKSNSDIMSSFEAFGTAFEQKNSSTGESVFIALNSLFKLMFTEGAILKFDYTQFDELYHEYVEYTKNHTQTDIPDSFTIMMDEPDRNLDIKRAKEILGILSEKKERTQLIAVVHNPLLIYALANKSHINFIEMTPGYVGHVMTQIDEIIKK